MNRIRLPKANVEYALVMNDRMRALEVEMVYRGNGETLGNIVHIGVDHLHYGSGDYASEIVKRGLREMAVRIGERALGIN